MVLKFSLIIPLAPYRNAEILKSIDLVNYPKKDYEIIIERGLNPSDNRNRGAEKSKGEILGFLDDDAILNVSILKNVEKFFKKNKNTDIVGGPQLTPDDDKGFAKISGYALCSIFGAWKLSNRYSKKQEILDCDETCLTSANLFCRRKVLKKIKFNPKLFPGEDPKFIDDAKKQEFKVAYSPNILVYHRRRNSFAGLIKQIYSYGKTRPKKEKIKDTLKKPFFIIPSLFCLYLTLIMVFITGNLLYGNSFIQIFRNSYFIMFLIPLFIYILMTIFFSIYDSLYNKDYKAFFFLLLIYPAIHLSYGFGMIMGYLIKR